MKYLRRISTGRLLALCAATVAFGVGAVALAMAATGGGPKPPAEPLPVAVHDALTAPTVQGVSARIQFTNHLINGSNVQGADPILSGATGRLWASSDGHLRLELQADSNSEGATTRPTGATRRTGSRPPSPKSRMASRSWPTAPW